MLDLDPDPDPDPIETDSGSDISTMPSLPERTEFPRASVAHVVVEPPKRSKADAVIERVDALTTKVDELFIKVGELFASRPPSVREVLDRHEQEALAVKKAELETAHRISERARWGEWFRGSLTWGLQGLTLVAAYLWGTPHTQETVFRILDWLQVGSP